MNVIETPAAQWLRVNLQRKYQQRWLAPKIREVLWWSRFMTPKGLTHKAGLNTGTHYFFCVRWDLFGSPALSTLRRGHNHWPKYGLVSVYTWSLFTAPQIVTMYRKVSASARGDKNQSQANLALWSTSTINIFLDHDYMWLFIFLIFPLTVGTSIHPNQPSLVHLSVCNNIKYILITRKNFKI